MMAMSRTKKKVGEGGGGGERDGSTSIQQNAMNDAWGKAALFSFNPVVVSRTRELFQDSPMVMNSSMPAF